MATLDRTAVVGPTPRTAPIPTEGRVAALPADRRTGRADAPTRLAVIAHDDRTLNAKGNP